MSTAPTSLAREVEALREEVHLLTQRVRALELVASAQPSQRGGSGSAAGYPSGTTGSALAPERLAAAKEVGQWIVRCLAKQHRGLSGREKITQASRYYLVVKSFDGEVYDPPLLFTTWRETAVKVSPAGQPGDSIYVGFPTHEECRLALREAGLSLPSALERV